MGGSIRVQSELGKGSEFEFTVIMQQSEKTQPDIPFIHLDNMAILVVDDNATSRKVLRYVKKIRNVMVALDSSEGGKISLQLAISLVNQIPGGQLILSHVKKDPSGKSMQDYTADAEKDPVVAEAAAKAKKMGIKYRCVAASGKPGPEICKISQDLNVDLLILGSPDRRPSSAKNLVDLDKLLGNSLSDYVRVYANCPVLLVRQSAS
ncbi:MAG: universal stress protein [Okeania sp. SIO3C4]|nr:universal stress protein [Okeania sp. SIO3C4]